MSSQMYALLRTCTKDTDIVAVSTEVDNLKARTAVDADDQKVMLANWVDWGGGSTINSTNDEYLWQIVEVEEV